MNRKAFIQKFISHISLGAFLAYLASCKTKKDKSQPPQEPINQHPSDPNAQTLPPLKTVVNPNDIQSTLPGPVIGGFCPSFDFQKLSPLDTQSTCVLRVFGKGPCVLVCVNFPFYQFSGMDSVFLTNEKGQVLGQRNISLDMDIKPDKTLLPVIFDGISASETDLLKMDSYRNNSIFGVVVRINGVYSGGVMQSLLPRFIIQTPTSGPEVVADYPLTYGLLEGSFYLDQGVFMQQASNQKSSVWPQQGWPSAMNLQNLNGSSTDLLLADNGLMLANTDLFVQVSLPHPTLQTVTEKRVLKT